jgi:hypothetical protein
MDCPIRRRKAQANYSLLKQGNREFFTPEEEIKVPLSRGGCASGCFFPSDVLTPGVR